LQVLFIPDRGGACFSLFLLESQIGRGHAVSCFGIPIWVDTCFCSIRIPIGWGHNSMFVSNPNMGGDIVLDSVRIPISGGGAFVSVSV